MKRYNVNVAVMVWLDKEVRAKDEEEARAKVLAQAQHHMNTDGFSWVDGKVEIGGSMNTSLLAKISY